MVASPVSRVSRSASPNPVSRRWCLLWTILLLAAITIAASDTDDANGTALQVAEPNASGSIACDVTEGYFQCSPLECIAVNLTCDGVPHCSNGTDEAVPLCGCLSNEFSCGDTCIDKLQRCDTRDDCTDGSDEQNCELYSCPHTHMTCTNHKCVPHDVICDFVDDCGDGSDELHCNRRKCWHGEFTCQSGQCVRPAAVCDGRHDCHDASDEADCSADSFVTCGNGGRVHRHFWCDGGLECTDNHADETNCGACSSHKFRCPNGRCIRQSAVCDGVCDCAGSCDDETSDDCQRYYNSTNGVVQCNRQLTWPCFTKPPGLVPASQVSSPQLTCVGSKFICDGQYDCNADDVKHMSDEHDCPRPSGHQTCNSSAGNFHCGDGRCVPRTVLCDHKPDCDRGEDETDCVTRVCGADQWRCSSGQCVTLTSRCNMTFECYDRSDETDCEDFVCPPGHLKCDGHQCIPQHKWCDHVTDCPDHSDESTCPIVESCLPHQYRCASGQCVDMRHRCYNSGLPHDGCADGSHLINCSEWQCAGSDFKCLNGPCLNQSLLCNGVFDCSRGWNDEDPCTFDCSDDSRCQCRDVAINCTGLGRTTPPSSIESQITKFDFRQNRINLTESLNLFLQYEKAKNLDLSSNGITHIPPMMFRNMFRLHVLDLRDNHITVIENHTFFGLQNVRALFLRGNGIRVIQESAFLGLSSLTILDLSDQRLTFLPSRCFVGLRRLANLKLSSNGLRHLEVAAFAGLSKLLVLDISNNNIEDPPKEVFRSLTSLNHLETDMFGLCCLARHVGTCLPAADEFSSCEDLMSNIVLRCCIWVLGAIALVGNLLVMCWRVLHKTSNRVHSFLIMNLAFSDCLMGVYLLLIAVVDQYYRGRYSMHELSWRSSQLCHLAGFISTFSSELSVFTLTVITLDRFLAIIFPFHLDRLEMSRTRLIMFAGWSAVALLAASPLMPLPYFSGFYGRSGVCLALHITPDYPPGWEYSVFVFLVLNLVSFGVIALGYACMFVAAKRTQAAVPALRRRSKRSARNDGAMARRMSLIVVTDAACWLPIIALGIASLCGVSVPPQIYAWVAVFVLPLNAAVNPLLYTLSTVQFAEQAEKRLHTFQVSWKRSFTMKTCTTAVSEGRANEMEPPTWSPRVYKFAPVNQSEAIETVALVNLSQRRQKTRVQVTGSLAEKRDGKSSRGASSSSGGSNPDNQQNQGGQQQQQQQQHDEIQKQQNQQKQKQRQRKKNTRNDELYE